jgi:lysyl endopeptidase
MIFKILFVCVVYALLLPSLKAQLQFNGYPVLSASDVVASEIPIVTMPAFVPDSEVHEGRVLKALRFAHPFFVDITTENSGVWRESTDGSKVWAVRIKSPNAYSLNLIFDRFELPDGAQLFLYSPSQTVVAGAFTNKSHTGQGVFATLPLNGDELVVEYSQGPHVQGKLDIKIAAVNHDYKNIFNNDLLKVGNFGDADDCHTDVSCVMGSYPEEKAVVRLIVDGTEVCTGTLINNTENNGIPYFITAAHCLRADRSDHSFLFLFNYQVPNCQTYIEGYKSQSLTGASIVARIDKMDCLLIRSNQAPPASYRPYWAGWDLAASFSPPFHAIHHPWGDVKKFARSTQGISQTTYPEVPNPFDNNAHWLVPQWQTGTTESGSSGCALFNSSGRFIGGLSGGYATCGDPVLDYFSMFNKAFEYSATPSLQLKTWLDAAGTNAKSVNGYDFYNDALPERISNFAAGDSAIFTETINSSIVRWMGNNSVGVDAVAERFDVVESCTLEGIYLMVGRSFSSGNLGLKVWSDGFFSEGGVPVLDTLLALSSFRAPGENLVMLRKKLKLVAPVSVSLEIPAVNFALFYQYNLKGRSVNSAYLRKDGAWQPFSNVHPDGNRSSAYIDLLASDVVLNDSVDVNEPQEKVVVYPNPAKQKVNFKWGIDPLIRLDVVSVSGQKIASVPYAYTYGDESFNVTSLPNGVYLFVFVFNNSTQLQKIIVKK